MTSCVFLQIHHQSNISSKFDSSFSSLGHMEDVVNSFVTEDILGKMIDSSWFRSTVMAAILLNTIVVGCQATESLVGY